MITDLQIDQSTKDFAEFLQSREPQISSQWMARVHSFDSKVRAINPRQLKNSVPSMIHNLVQCLNSPEDLDSVIAEQDARTYGRIRWRQGCRLNEFLREFARMRMLLLDEAFVFEGLALDFNDQAKQAVHRRLHHFVDEIAAWAAEQYVSEQQADLRCGNVELREMDSSRLRLLRISSHELRNAVNSAQITLKELREESNHAARQELTMTLVHTTNHMEELLHDLFDLALLSGGKEEVRLDHVWPAELMQELLEVFRPQTEARGLTLETNCDPSIGSIVSDATKLRQIAENLLSNAVKYTMHGHVRLLFTALDSDRWAMAVEDTGPGIPSTSNERDQIFTEFHRLSQTAHLQGSGLGLAIVKQLVELLGGKIHVESAPSRGTRFQVTLPRDTESPKFDAPQ